VLAPGDPFVLAELLALTEERRYQELLHRYFSPLDAQFLLGRALLAHGEHQKAASCFFYVVPRLPELRSARVHLAAALAGTGRIESAAATYLEAMAMAPEPLLLDPDIPELMRRWASSPSASPLDRFHAAQVLHRYGYLSEGLQILAGLAVAGHAGEETRPSAIEVRAEEERIRRALSPPETAATAGALAQSSQ
jgi:tetratricopeptide (TPR) repeat protein